MQSVELKLRLINSSKFVVGYTKMIAEILGEPEMSIEVKAGKIKEDVSRLVESIGYKITGERPLDDWVALKAVKPR
jgi:hypothetical protein